MIRAVAFIVAYGTVAAIQLGGTTMAQGFVQQPGSTGPNAFGQQQGPFQPAPVPPGGVPSLVGTWSGQRFDQNGPMQQSDAFSPDGKYVSVARLANGLVGRVWGYYRSTPAGPNQLRVDFQAQGWLPQQVCRQAPGYAPQCQPFQVPVSDTVFLTFLSPDQFQSVSQSTPGPPLTEARDNQAPLLQVQAPQQWVINMPAPAPPAVMPAPVITPYVSPTRRGPATNIPGLGGNCDDLQQRRICGINGGQLVPSGGCLTCVN